MRVTIAALLFTGGCVTRVTPPAAPPDAVAVFLVDYGHHASLVLPRDEHTLVEYAYGEWNWFALNHQQWFDAIPALLWPTPGALGRRDWTIDGDAEAVARQLRARRAWRLDVPRAAVATLLAELDERFESAAEPPIYNRLRRLTFARDPRAYWLGRHCNTVVADWLRRLGCRVTSPVLGADFLVTPPGAPADAPPAGR